MLTTVGLITALLYLFGRAYGSALITTLKLPEILLPISLNQYYEWGAAPLFGFAFLLAAAATYVLGVRFVLSNAVFFTIALFIDAFVMLITLPFRVFWRWLVKFLRKMLSGLVSIISPSAKQWLQSRLQSFQRWLQSLAQKCQQWLQSRVTRYQRWFPIDDNESQRLNRLSQYYTIVLTLLVGVLVAGWALQWVLNESMLLGRSNAIKVTVQPARLFLSQPISSLPGQASSLSDGTTGYVYATMFLIAHTEDHYFVFEALDSASCTPREVLQVPASHVVDVVYGAPQHLDQLCQSMFPPVAPTPVPGPTATAVPTP